MVKKERIFILLWCYLLSTVMPFTIHAVTRRNKSHRSSIFDAVDAHEAHIKHDLLAPTQSTKIGRATEKSPTELMGESNTELNNYTTVNNATDKQIISPVDQEATEPIANQGGEQKNQEYDTNKKQHTIDAYPGAQNQKSLDIFFEPGESMLPEGEITLEPATPSSEQQPIDQSSSNEQTDKVNEQKSNEDELIEFYFEDADILNLLTQISELFDNITFITDEIMNPLGPGGKALKGNKISFKTHKPLTKKAAWNLFLTFLDLAGFALIPETSPGFYRVVVSEKAQYSPVPTYIGVHADLLPDNDQVIRYIYFIQNARAETIKDIVNTLKSPNSRAVILQELKALVITDRAYNIRSLMEIVHELDQVTMPQSMSVLKLTNADASDVKKLYDSLTKTSEEEPPSKLFAARKQPSSIYFPENTRMIVEPRTNSLILLGSVNAIKKIEDFIIHYVDVDLDKPYSPLYTHQLRYASATTIADIMNSMTQFGADTAAGKNGGVRGGDKYLKPMTFTPEPATNTLIIKGDYEDYLKALGIIKKLDEPQPQVAVEGLILTVNFDDLRDLGTQLRNKVPGSSGTLSNGAQFQTSGLRLGGSPSGIVTNNSGQGADRLLGNLINLVQNAIAGNTVVSLGADLFGVWGIFSILQSITNTQVVSNPFLVATNKTKSSVAVGNIRRVATSNIYAGQTNTQEALGDFSAQLKLEVTPQINSDGMIVLKLNVLYENFVGSLTNVEEAAKQTRLVDTRTIVADKEVIAIGGLVQNTITETLTKVPILGDIPILGWLFKNKHKEIIKNNLLILIATRIIEPEVTETVDVYTKSKLDDYYEVSDRFNDIGEYRDPIYKRFFNEVGPSSSSMVEEFVLDKTHAEHPEELSSKEHKTGGKDASIFQKSAWQKKKSKLESVTPDEIEEKTSARAARQASEQPDTIDSIELGQLNTIQLSQHKPSRRRDARRASKYNQDHLKGIVA